MKYMVYVKGFCNANGRGKKGKPLGEIVNQKTQGVRRDIKQLTIHETVL